MTLNLDALGPFLTTVPTPSNPGTAGYSLGLKLHKRYNSLCRSLTYCRVPCQPASFK